MRGPPPGFLQKRGNIGQRGIQGPLGAHGRPGGAARGGVAPLGRLGARWGPLALLRGSGSFRLADLYGIFGAF